MRTATLRITLTLSFLSCLAVLATLFAAGSDGDAAVREQGPRPPAPAWTNALDAESPRILTHSPWIEETGILAADPAVHIVFGDALEPSSVNERSIRIGYRDEREDFRPLSAAVTLEGDRVVSVRPRAWLWPAVYYEVRVLGGEEGVRARGGGPLSEDYRWRFATQVEFHPSPAPAPFAAQRTSPFRLASSGPVTVAHPPLQVGVCQKPTGSESRPEILVHVYQVSCDAALVPGKMAMVQAYAVWQPRPGVASAQQVTQFDAEVEFRQEAGPMIGGGPIQYTFYRPDMPVFKGLQVVGAAAARRFGWKPQPEAGAEASFVEVTVKPTSAPVGTPPRFSPGKRDFEWAPSRFGRGSLTAHFFTFTFDGATGFDPPPQSEIQRVAREAEEFIAQTFPVLEPSFPVHPRGSIRVPVGPSTAITPQTVYPRLLQAIDASPSVRAGDVVIALLPAGVLPPGIAAQNVQNCPEYQLFGVTYWTSCTRKVLFMSIRNRGHTYAHEIGHYYGLLHCPAQACARLTGANRCRTNPCDIEGYRLDQRLPTGWSKSDQEGNEQAPELEPLLWFQGNNIGPGGAALATLATPDQRFIAMDSYRTLLQEFTHWQPGGSTWFPWESTDGQAGRSTLFPEGMVTPLSSAPVDEAGVRFATWPAAAGGDRALGEVCVAPAPRLPTLGAPPALSRPRIAVGYRAPQATTDGTTLAAYGFVRSDGSEASIDGVSIVPRDASDDDPVAPVRVAAAGRPVPGVVVALMAADGTLLAEVPMSVPEISSHGDEVPPDGEPLPFAVYFEGTPDAAVVSVRGPAGTLAERSRSASVPTVTLESPSDGGTLNASSEIRWRGTDEDGDELLYDIMTRPGPDEPWMLLASRTAGMSLRTEGLPIHAGPAPEIRIVATDGFNTSAPATIEVRVRRPLPSPVTLPAPDEIDVAVNTMPSAFFPSELDPDGLTTSNVTVEAAPGGAVPVGVSLDETGRVLMLTPEEPLRYGTTYTVRLHRAISDRWDNSLATDHIWSFTTADDEIPPFVARSIPAPGAITVAPDAELRVVFTEPLDPASANPASFRVQDPSGTAVAGSVSWDEQSLSLIFRPASPLERRTRFTVTVEDVRDLAGTELPQPYSFSFTTAGAILPVGSPTSLAGGGP